MKKYVLVIALSALLGFICGWIENDARLIPLIIAVAIVPVFLVMCLLFAIVKKWRKKLRWALPVLIGAFTFIGTMIVTEELFLPKYDAWKKERARLEQVARHPALIDEYIAEHRTTTAKEFSRYELVSSREDNQLNGYKYNYSYLFEYPNNVTDTVFFVFKYENSDVEVSENFEKNPFTPTEEQLLAKLGIKFKQFEHEHYNLKLDRLATEEGSLFNSYLHYFNEMSGVDLYDSKEVECKLKSMAVPISGFDFYYWDMTNISTPETTEELDTFIKGLHINHLSYQQYIPAYRKSTITLTADRTPERFSYYYVPRVKGEDIIRAYINGASFSEKSFNYSSESYGDKTVISYYLANEGKGKVDKKKILQRVVDYVVDEIRASLQKEYLDALLLPYKQDLERRKL